MPEQRIVWLDLETGGTDERVHQIIQVAAIATTMDLRTIEEFEVKIHLEDGRCEPEALVVNAFDPATWAREAVSSPRAMDSFAGFLKRHATLQRTSRRGKPYRIAELAGHNLEFDVRFLRAWFGDAYLPASAWTGGYYDTLHMARTITLITGRRWSSHKLGELCRECGIEPPNHDALEDVRATIKLAEALMGIVTTREAVVS